MLYRSSFTCELRLSATPLLIRFPLYRVNELMISSFQLVIAVMKSEYSGILAETNDSIISSSLTGASSKEHKRLKSIYSSFSAY